MFIIPCKSSNQNFIYDMVQSVRLYHPTEKIVVVDSDSTDKSYFKELEKYDVIIEDIANKNYIDGAIWFCYHKYADDFFYALHDSMVVKQNLDQFKNSLFTAISFFPGCFGEGQEEYVVQQICKTKYHYETENWYGLFGGAFMCQRSVLDRFYQKDLHKALPINRLGMEGNERIWGMALKQEGFILPQISITSGPFHEQPNPYISKFFPRRP